MSRVFPLSVVVGAGVRFVAGNFTLAIQASLIGGVVSLLFFTWIWIKRVPLVKP